MDQIGVVGASYRHASTDEIAALTISRSDIPLRLPELREALGASELLYLATCNRVEVLYAMPEGIPAPDCRAELFQALIGRAPRPEEARSALRAWTGEAAVEHLFLVACGLDSAQTGEREIALQLRAAWDAARAAGVSGPTLDRVVGDALGMARRVEQLAADARPTSLADLATERVLQHLPGHRGRVALVGVSPMTRRCGRTLQEAGVPVVIVNRTVETAREWAEDLGAPLLSLEAFRAEPGDLAGIIVATGGNEPVLDAGTLARIASSASATPLIVDFGLPPNVEVAAARKHGIPRLGMDEMIDAAQAERISQLLRLAPVRAAIDEQLERLRQELATRAIGPQLAGLRSTFEEIASAEADRLLSEDLPGLGEREQAAIRRFAVTLGRRLAHLPIAGLRAAVSHAGPEAMEAFFREARLQRTRKGSTRSFAGPRTDGKRAAPHTRAPSSKDTDPE